MKRSLEIVPGEPTKEEQEAGIDITILTNNTTEDLWAARLEEAKRCAKKTLKELASESENLSKSRYGDHHKDYSPEPDSITILTELSVRNYKERKFMREVRKHLARFNTKKEAALKSLQFAKRKDNKADVRCYGGQLNTLSKTQKRISKIDCMVGQRIHICTRKLAEYRANAVGREICEEAEKVLASEVTPDMIGYQRVLDFYRLSDPYEYSFGRHIEGLQHYTDIRRNVAIMSVKIDNSIVYNDYSVSGDCGIGVPTDTYSVFTSCHATDTLGGNYDRCFDAEYKLISFFLSTLSEVDDGSREAHVTLWSKKPLCDSCSNVLLTQLPENYPRINLKIIIEDEDLPVSIESETVDYY